MHTGTKERARKGKKRKDKAQTQIRSNFEKLTAHDVMLVFVSLGLKRQYTIQHARQCVGLPFSCCRSSKSASPSRSSSSYPLSARHKIQTSVLFSRLSTKKASEMLLCYLNKWINKLFLSKWSNK